MPIFQVYCTQFVRGTKNLKKKNRPNQNCFESVYKDKLVLILHHGGLLRHVQAIQEFPDILILDGG